MRRSKRSILRRKKYVKYYFTIITALTTLLIIIGYYLINSLNKNVIIIEENNNVVIKEEVFINKNIENYNQLDSYEYKSVYEDLNADNADMIKSMLNNYKYKRSDGKKVAYLTFDDGPSENVTHKILDILQRNNIKGTFFVLGSMIEKNESSKLILNRLVAEGHAIGNHGYCHKYEILYPKGIVDVNAFMKDINKSEAIMKAVLGKDFKTRVIRLPGGHGNWNTEGLDIELNNKGYVYIDWNTLNGDGEGINLPKDKLVDRFKTTLTDIYGNDDVLVVLMHDIDAKKTTVEALQEIIDYLKDLGYEFRTLK